MTQVSPVSFFLVFRIYFPPKTAQKTVTVVHKRVAGPMSENNQPDITTLTVQLLSAFVSNNSVTSESLSELIRTTRIALTDDLAAKPAEAATPTYRPAVSVRKSLSSPEHILSMIDGRPYKTLKRHLASHGLTPAEYRERYGLPKTYPLVAPNYSEARRAVATKLGLGKKPVSVKKAAPAPVAAATPAPVAKTTEAPKAPAAKPAVTKAPAAKKEKADPAAKAPAAKAAAPKAAEAKASPAKAAESKPAAKPASARKRLSIANPAADKKADKKDAAPAAKPATGEKKPAPAKTAKKPAAPKTAAPKAAAPKPAASKTPEPQAS
ncbi:MucR family transcriptional regulator [Sphingobium sp. Sx8-8]|uniref:MucR family transcriptional regulator n=1 Tax=Sphingobium sp. Sx8-8 TaxID=2933617 RepID=UPI001F565CA1|nr:MucR family transcriptional regulator [Sphingobium sp. Sx8-8]